MRLRHVTLTVAVLVVLTSCAHSTNHRNATTAPRTQGVATASPTPSPSAALPELWPTRVVAAMPAAMVSKYTLRLASSNDNQGDPYRPDRYFYFAHTLPDMPAYICLTLAANSGDANTTMFGTNLSPQAQTVLDRVQDYVTASGSKIEVRSNHTVTNTSDYVDFLAMDDDDLVNLSLQHFCPEMQPVWDKLRPSVREVADREAAQKAEDSYNETHPMVKFEDGTYTVGNQPRMIQPGTYRIAGPLRDCYWERSTANGSIIANAFLTNAPAGTRVTVSAGEGFTSRGCTSSNRWERISSG
jgi:hypothetical protein